MNTCNTDELIMTIKMTREVMTGRQVQRKQTKQNTTVKLTLHSPKTILPEITADARLGLLQQMLLMIATKKMLAFIYLTLHQ